MAADEAGLEKVLQETMVNMCRNKLTCHHQIDIQGLVAVTIDKKHVLLVHIDDVIKHTKAVDDGGSYIDQRNSALTHGVTLLSECMEARQSQSDNLSVKQHRSEVQSEDEVVIKEEVVAAFGDSLTELETVIKSEGAQLCELQEESTSQHGADNAMTTTERLADKDCLRDNEWPTDNNASQTNNVCPMSAEWPTDNGYSPSYEYSADHRRYSELHGSHRYHHSSIKPRKSAPFVSQYKAPRAHACMVAGCNASFTDSWLLKRHMVTHTGQKDFHCLLCSHKCNLKENLRAHMLRKHRDVDRYTVERLLKLAK